MSFTTWPMVLGERSGVSFHRSLVLPLIAMPVCFHSAPTYRFFPYRKTQNTTTRRQHIRHGVPDQERTRTHIESPPASRRGIESTRHDSGGCECATFLAGHPNACYRISTHLFRLGMVVVQHEARIGCKCCRAASAAQPPGRCGDYGRKLAADSGLHSTAPASIST